MPKKLLNNENREIDYYEIHGVKNLFIKSDGDIELKIIIEKLVEQKIKFVLIDNSDTPDLKKLIELSKKITYFLQFALFSKVKMYDVSTSVDGKGVEIHDSYIPDYIENDKGNILFDVDTFNRLNCDIGDILNCWIAKFDLFEISLNLYLNQDSSIRFFDLYRCLERLASELSSLKSKSYDDIIQEFVSYSKDILSITTEDGISKYTKIMERIFDIRGAFAHAWREDKSKLPISDIDLQNEKFYRHLMEFIFQSIVLRELGLCDDNIKRITPNNYLKFQIQTIEVDMTTAE